MTRKVTTVADANGVRLLIVDEPHGSDFAASMGRCGIQLVPCDSDEFTGECFEVTDGSQLERIAIACRHWLVQDR